MMITATEARKLANDIKNANNEELLQNIEDKIYIAINRGEYKITLDNSLSTDVKTHLKEKGYEIQTVADPRDRTVLVTISW